MKETRKHNQSSLLFLFAFLYLFLFITGCGDGSGLLGLGPDDCNKDINELLVSYGNPDNITRYDSDDYHSWSYRYIKHKLIKTFTWSDDIDCTIDTYSW